MFKRSLLLGTCVCVSTATTALSCSIQTSGAKCATAKAPPAYAAAEVAKAPTGFQPGDILPKGKYFMLLNSQSYGLPPASDGLLYFRAGQQVLRVRLATMEVSEDVTALLTRRLP